MTDQIPLIKDDGTPFSSGEVAEVSAALDPLDAEARVGARNRNADAIAEHEAARMLVRFQALAPARTWRSWPRI